MKLASRFRREAGAVTLWSGESQRRPSRTIRYIRQGRQAAGGGGPAGG